MAPCGLKANSNLAHYCRLWLGHTAALFDNFHVREGFRQFTSTLKHFVPSCHLWPQYSGQVCIQALLATQLIWSILAPSDMHWQASLVYWRSVLLDSMDRETSHVSHWLSTEPLWHLAYLQMDGCDQKCTLQRWVSTVSLHKAPWQTYAIIAIHNRQVQARAFKSSLTATDWKTTVQHDIKWSGCSFGAFIL